MKALWNKSKQFLVPAIKILVTAVCIAVIIYQWQQRPIELSKLENDLAHLSWYVIPLMICFSLSSWMVESKKWQYLIDDLWKLRFRESVIQNLIAQTASYITPFRAGEFATKTALFPATLRKEIAGHVLVGNLSQLSITLILGLLGSSFVLDTLDLSFMVYIVVIALFMLVVVFGIWVFKKWSLTALPINKLVVVTLYSFVRYLLFAVNWIIILKALGCTDSVFLIAQKTAVMYFLFSIIPVIQFLDIPVRWTVATFVFSGSVLPDEMILIATTIVWFTNSIIPTVIGAIILPFYKFKVSVV